MSFEEPDSVYEKQAKDYCTEYIERFEKLVRAIIHDVTYDDESSSLELANVKTEAIRELFDISMHPYKA